MLNSAVSTQIDLMSHLDSGQTALFALNVRNLGLNPSQALHNFFHVYAKLFFSYITFIFEDALSQTEILFQMGCESKLIKFHQR